MINFIKSLFTAKPETSAAPPPPKSTDLPVSLLNGLETQIERAKKVATEEEKTVLDQLFLSVQQSDLAGTARHFHEISKLSKDWHLENAGILMSARINKMLKEKESGLLDAEKLKLERNVLMDSLIGGIGNIGDVLKQR